MKATVDKRYCQFNPGHFTVWAELTDIRTRPVSVTHFIGLSDGLLEGKYRLVQAPVDNKSTSVKMFVVDQHPAWSVITSLKLKDEEERQQDEAQDQRTASPPTFGRQNHRQEPMAEVEGRRREQQALVADIESMRQTDDDKQL